MLQLLLTPLKPQMTRPAAPSVAQATTYVVPVTPTIAAAHVEVPAAHAAWLAAHVAFPAAHVQPPSGVTELLSRPRSAATGWHKLPALRPQSGGSVCTEQAEAGVFNLIGSYPPPPPVEWLYRPACLHRLEPEVGKVTSFVNG
jgi:hypothetical protein